MRSMVEGALRAPEKTYGRARQLRRQMSLPEIVLWQALRKRQLVRTRFAGSTRSGRTFSISIVQRRASRSRWMEAGTTSRPRRITTSAETRGLCDEGSASFAFLPPTCCATKHWKMYCAQSKRPSPPPPARCARHLPRGAGEDPTLKRCKKWRCTEPDRLSLNRHCEERSDEAISIRLASIRARLLRFARNDSFGFEDRAWLPATALPNS